MAESEAIGGVSVQITGDASGLGPSFAAAQNQAQAAGQKIAASFNTGAVGADQITAAIERLTVALREESAAATLAAQRNASLAQSSSSVSGGLRQIGDAAQHSGFSLRYAFFGIKDIAEGRGAFAMAEIANVLVRLGPLAIAAGAAIGIIAAGIYEAVTASERFQNIVLIFSDLDRAARTANEELQVSNDRLANEIAKIEKKPENGLKLALDEDALAADKLGESLDKAIEKIQKAMKDAKTGFLTQVFSPTAGTGDADKRSQALRAQLAQDQGSVAVQQQDIEFELNNIQQEIVRTLNAASHEMGRLDYGPALTRLKEYARNYQAEIDRIDLTQKNSGLQGGKATAQAGEEQQRLSEKAADVAREQLRKRIEIFESERRAQEELQAAQERGQDELNGAAQKLYDTNKRAADEAAKMAASMRLSGAELANKSSEELSGQKPPTRGETTREEPVNQSALQRLQESDQQRLADEIKLQQVGIQTNNEIQSRIGNLQQELAAAERLNVPIETRLRLEKEVLDAKIAAASANGQTDQTDKLAAAQNTIQQAVTQWKSIDIGNVAQSAAQTAVKGVDQISASLANAIVQGKGFGQAMVQTGKQIAASLLTTVIEAGLKRALAALLALVPGFQAVSGAQAAATAQQKAVASASVLTAAGEAAAWAFESVMAALPFPVNVAVAPEVATAAFAQTSAFGAFAAGTDSAPGGFAMVGEKGPELMYVPKGAQITPNHALKGFAGGTGGYANVSRSSSSSTSVGELHVHAHGVNDPVAFAKAAVAAIPRELKRQSGSFSPYSS